MTNTSLLPLLSADVPDVVRRVAYIAVVPLFEERASRAMFGCVLSMLMLVLHTNIKPYAKQSTNTLAEAADYQVS